MKKEQKIIELRRAAKLKVAELETKIAIARSDAADFRARIMLARAAMLDGLKADSTERLDVIAVYRAKLADVAKKYESTVAKHKAEIMQIKSECERECAAAEDDQEPETDVTVKGSQPQETVYCDGSEHSARIVARRLINKMPHIPKDGYLFVHVIREDLGAFFVSISAHGNSTDIHEIFSKCTHTAEFEAAFIEKSRRLFAEDPESGNSHVAKPLSRALDAVFGGNPVEKVDNLISDTIKDGKEGGNE